MRRCVYDDMAPSLRAAMHAQAARELIAEGREGAAAHLIATDAASDRWVVEQLEAAAQRAMAQGAPDAAARFLARALAEPPPPDMRGRVLGALGAAEARVPNRRGEAVDHLREAASLAEDPFSRLFHGIELGQALLVAGRVDEAAEVLDAELRALPDEHDQIGHLLQSVLQMASYASPRARALVDERGWRFRGDDDGQPETPGDRVWLAVRSTEVAFSGGTAAQARDLAVRALDGGRLLAEQSADSAAFYLAANTLIHVDALDEAIAAYDAAVAEAQRRGSLRGFGMASCWRAYAHFWRGSLADAIADARATLDAVSEADLALGAPQAGSFIVHALTDTGELEAADAALREARAASDQAGDQVGVDLLHYAAGRLRLAQGRHDHALEELTTCGRRQAAWGIHTPLTLWRSEAARALVGLDRRDEARSLAAEEVEVARAWGEGSRQHAIALRGLAAASEGAEAVALLRASAEILARSPARLERARTLLELGSALRRGGERTAARDPLRDALTIARECGAHPLAARAHDELSATGVHQRKILRAGVDALTPSERRIAELRRRRAEQPRHRRDALRHRAHRRGAPRARLPQARDHRPGRARGAPCRVTALRPTGSVPALMESRSPWVEAKRLEIEACARDLEDARAALTDLVDRSHARGLDVEELEDLGPVELRDRPAAPARPPARRRARRAQGRVGGVAASPAPPERRPQHDLQRLPRPRPVLAHELRARRRAAPTAGRARR